MKNLSTKVWWAITVVLAFASAISFMQINSAWADEHHFNGFFGWVGIGIITGLGAIYGLSKVIKQSDSGKEER